MEALPKEKLLEIIEKTPASDPAKRVKYRGLSVCIVMPCWNEEGKVGDGVRSVPRDKIDTVCVVNNGSADKTREEALEAGAIVLDHPINQGAGGGIRSGLFYGKKNGFDLLAVLAGDNQDDPNDLPKVIDKLIDENLDYVQGSRWMKGGKRENMTVSRSILTNVYSLLFRVFFGKRITDATNGFRVFKPEILDHPKVNLWQDWMIQYELEPYLLIKSCKFFKVDESPVRKIYHSNMKSNTKMVPFKGWWSILRPLFLLKFNIRY
tara:strand:+ start:2111 stop:2902 length:792 start_codon:yes stop_codon:yes gene_type:complete